MSRSRTVVIALLSAWTLLLLVTHRGSRSPYSYIAQMTDTVDRVVNKDALTVIPVTRFFYDGTPADWSRAHNMKLPLHSFAAATVASFVRPYLLANDVTNFIFAVLLIVVAVKTAERFGIGERAMALAFATILALPPFVGYLGQPMHYIVGPVVSYLVVMTALALPETDLRNPWIAGALTAILTLNYDWYVFGAALAIYVLAVLRFRSRRDDLIYLAVSIAPVVLWHAFLRLVSRGMTSTVIRDAFIETVIVQWAELFRDPAKNVLMPFVAAHIGVHIGIDQVLALIHWPLLAACAIALWRSRPSLNGNRLLLLLVIAFFFAQVVTAAFDVENNPRRALPVFFVFASLYCLAVDRRSGDKRWTAAFIVLFALTSFFAFADVILKRPGAGFLYMGEAIRSEPKRAMEYVPSELRIAGEVAEPQRPALRSFPPARIDMAGAFVAAQAFVGFWFVVLFVLLGRAALLPRYAPHAFVALWLLSAVRFL